MLVNNHLFLVHINGQSDRFIYLRKIDKIYSEVQKKSPISSYICAFFLENTKYNDSKRFSFAR